MQIKVANHLGYCSGVRRAVNGAYAAPKDTCILGEIIHNAYVVKDLAVRGINTVNSISDVKTRNVIIRSHGVGDDVMDILRTHCEQIFDYTCCFVTRTHDIVRAHHLDGYRIIIIGKQDHAEVIGINGCCNYSAIVLSSVKDCIGLHLDKKICIVAQTTFNYDEYSKIIKILSNLEVKTLEIFDTICYTTLERQNEVKILSQTCDKMLILGSPKSSNTNQLYEISKQFCELSYLISDIKELSCIFINSNDSVGITAGASTHDELIQEVLQFMSENNKVQLEAEKENFGAMLEKQENESVVCRVGAVIKDAEVISATEDGVTVNIGGKNDGFIDKDEACSEGTYSPADFRVGSKLGVIVTATKNKETGLIPVSKRKLDAINKGNEVVNTIRNGEEFSLVVGEVVLKGLTGKLGNYRVFIPQSHVDERFVKNLAPFKGKTLRLRALEIDDEKHKIVASQKAILEEERNSKEKEFFDNIYEGVNVIGKVMRATKFGAFVNVGGVDCLAHIVDLSWTKINSVEDVLKIGNEYEFTVLKIDREKKRVSLGFKQLSLPPFDEVVKNHNVGDVIEGTIVRIKDFGAFVKIADGVDGLVHISEASHNYVKDINEVLKVGDVVKSMITKIDDANRKISLSIKAATEPPVLSEMEASDSEHKPRSSKFNERKPRTNKDESTTWNEDTSNNPFADLLKDVQDDEKSDK